MKTAVIGTGAMGKNHIRIYSELDNIVFVGFSDISEKARNYYSKKYGIKSYEKYQVLYENERPDAVSIVTPTKTHYEIAKYFIEKRVHVLIEKPITNDLDKAQKLIRLAEENKVLLTVGHIERFNPAVIELKKRIQAGELGKVFKIDINRVGPYPGRITDVGVTEDLAVHDIDVMRYILESEPKRMFAELGFKMKKEKEDLLSGLIRFSNNTICNLNINWLTPTKIRKLYITGEKGMFVADYLQQKLFFFENDYINGKQVFEDTSLFSINEGKMIRYNIDKKEPLKAELEHFVDCIKNNKKPNVSGLDGLYAVKIAQDFIRSYKEKRPIWYEDE